MNMKGIFFYVWLVSFLISATVKSFAQTDTSLYYDKGVIINGVKWATRNVGEPGMFVENYEKTGEYYQWNCPKAWKIQTNASGEWYNPNLACDCYSEDTIWNTKNDPSPQGWRIPSLREIQSLFDTTKVLHYTIQTRQCCLIAVFIDKSSGDSLFLPGYGGLHHYPDFYVSQGDAVSLHHEYGWYSGCNMAFYWSNTIYSANHTNSYTFFISKESAWKHFDNRHGYFIRPVAK